MVFTAFSFSTYLRLNLFWKYKNRSEWLKYIIQHTLKQIHQNKWKITLLTTNRSAAVLQLLNKIKLSYETKLKIENCSSTFYPLCDYCTVLLYTQNFNGLFSSAERIKCSNIYGKTHDSWKYKKFKPIFMTCENYA